MTRSYIAKKMDFKPVKTVNGIFYRCNKCGDLVTKEHRELHELARHTYWTMAKPNKTMMRIDKELLDEIRKCRITERESYAEVVKRLINKDRKTKKWKRDIVLNVGKNWNQVRDGKVLEHVIIV